MHEGREFSFSSHDAGIREGYPGTAVASTTAVVYARPSEYAEQVHLGHRPQWNGAEIEALRELFTEVRKIGNNVNQIARALNVAAHKGEYSPYQGQEAREAAELVRIETRRIVAVMTGNFDYWGLPDADRPTAAPGAQERDDIATKKERRKIARQPRRRPARFVDK